MTSNEFNEDLAPDLAETADRLRRARQTLEGLRPRFERIADQSLARALDTPNPVAASS